MAKNCMICGEINTAAGIGAISNDRLPLCALCYTSAEFDRESSLKDYTSAEIIDFFVENDLFFHPDIEIVTYLNFGMKQTVVQFDEKRKLWRMIPYGKNGYRKEAWLFQNSDILDYEVIKYGKYASSCDSLKIKILIDDADNSAVYLTFIDHPYDIKKTSGRYKKIIDSVEICLSAFRKMKERK